jgi:Protein of unknown function (DUF3987)
MDSNSLSPQEIHVAESNQLAQTPPPNVKQTIQWLIRANRPPLPECPIQAATQGKEPKSPHYIDGKRVVSIQWKAWQSIMPPQETINIWFQDKRMGIGTLGGWNGKHWLCWVDIDQKTFPNQEECDRKVGEWDTKYNFFLEQAPVFRTPNGGYRYLVAFSEKPEGFGANNGFSFSSAGDIHSGELLLDKGHTLLPPTIGLNQKPYEWVRWFEYPPVVSSPEDIGLYAYHKPDSKSTNPSTNANSTSPSSGSNDTTISDFLMQEVYPRLTLEQAFNWEGHKFVERDGGAKLQGNCPWHDSNSGTAFWCNVVNGMPMYNCPIDGGGNVIQYRHRLVHGGGAASPRGKDFIDIVKQLAFEAGVLDRFPSNTNSNANSNKTPSIGNGSDGNSRISQISLRERLIDIASRDLSPALEKDTLINLSDSLGKRLPEIEDLYKLIKNELNQTLEVEDAKKPLASLLDFQQQTIDSSEYLWGDGGQLSNLLKVTSESSLIPESWLFTTFMPVSCSRISTSRIVVKAKSKYTQPAILRTCIIANTGDAKSPAQSIILDPLRSIETEEMIRWKAENNEYKESLKSFKKDEGEPPEPPLPCKRFIVEHHTSEGKIRILSENPKILIFHDEWSETQNARGMYSNGRGIDMEMQLSEFNGKPVVRDTADPNKSVYIEKSGVCRTGGTQLDTIKELMAGFNDSKGEFARTLFCTEECPPNYINLFEEDGDTGIYEYMEKVYCDLDKLPDNDYFLSMEAKGYFQSFQHQLVDARYAEEIPGLKAAYPKFESYLSRIALWLHCLNSVLAGNLAPEQFIDGRTMQAACKLVSYYIGQLKFLYATSSPQQQLTGELLKLKKFIDGKPSGVTVSQIKRGSNALKRVPTHKITEMAGQLVAEELLRFNDGIYYPIGGVGEKVGATTNNSSKANKATPNQGFEENSISNITPKVGGVGGNVGEKLVVAQNPETTSNQPLEGLEQIKVGEVGEVGGAVVGVSDFSQNLPPQTPQGITQNSTYIKDTTNITNTTNNLTESVGVTDVDAVGDNHQHHHQPPTTTNKTTSTSHTLPQFKVGDKIEFQHEDLGNGWHKGTVTRVETEQGYFVRYMVSKNNRPISNRQVA